MPLTPEEAERFEQAADVAKQRYVEMLNAMTPEERKGAEKVIGWWKANLGATHKRIFQIVNGRR